MWEMEPKSHEDEIREDGIMMEYHHDEGEPYFVEGNASKCRTRLKTLQMLFRLEIEKCRCNISFAYYVKRSVHPYR